MLLATLVTALCAAAPPFVRAEATPADESLVLFAHFDDQALTPISTRFFERALAEAELERAACLVIVLDTPGGLLDSTRALVRAELDARVPVVVWVPPGGRAASAGVFVTLAAHVAAMAPGSNIGAAHPVQVGGLPVGPPQQTETSGADTMLEKAVQDTAAWARALAELRGRNAEWAEKAVTESLSVTADEALREGVIDLVVASESELVERLDGRVVELCTGLHTLRTSGARVRALRPWWGERVLAAVADPNVAFLLLVLGVYGLLFELYSPGWGVPGTLGLIALCLGAFALALMPIDYAGLLLLALALGLFVAEAVVTSYGLLAVGGVACLVLGGLMLVDSPAGFLSVSLEVVLPVAAATAVIVVGLASSVIRAHGRRSETGGEGLLGLPAIAAEDFTGSDGEFSGRVRTHGELWTAESPAPVHTGEELRVRERRGMTLVVAAGNGKADARPPTS